MIQDATNQQIKAIQTLFPLAGKTVLEIGCGKGRVTLDLAIYAARVIASDPDTAAIEMARIKIRAPNVEFVHAAQGIPDLPEQSLDLVIYSLSLHHVPADDMQASLQQAGRLLKSNGAVLVLEPADGGTFNLAKSRFSVGSGDEGPLKAAARDAMHSLTGWQVSEDHYFMTEFLFTDEADFFTCKLPNFRDLAMAQQDEIRQFLRAQSNERGIILTSERCLNLLHKVK